MQLAEGVHLHLIKTEKFKTNHLTLRFSGQMTSKNRARRALVAQMLATANASYPTSQLFRRRLAELYGAHLSTRISTKGLVHIVDIDISFVSNRYALNQENVLQEILTFLQEVLFNPLITLEQYQSRIFETEQHNLMAYLEADREDVYYYSDLALEKLYYATPYLQESQYSTPDKVSKENAYTAFQEFRRMLKEDRIDLFLVGDIEEADALERLKTWAWSDRQSQLNYFYHQEVTNIIEERIEKRTASQSLLCLGYQLPIYYGQEAYPALLVLNGLLGLYPHSLLFTQIREREGLAYSISSQVNPYTGLLKIQAGISKSDRQRVIQLINQQLSALKTGRFSSQILRKTKSMILSGSRLAEDSPKGLIEQAYNRQLFPEATHSAQDFQNRLEEVSKQEIVKLAHQLKLQALYFMEGGD